MINNGELFTALDTQNFIAVFLYPDFLFTGHMKDILHEITFVIIVYKLQKSN